MEKRDKFEIHVKGGFSERKGFKHFSDIVQVESLNERTRGKLYTNVENMFYYLESVNIDYKKIFAEYIYVELFSKTKVDIPKIPYSNQYSYSAILNDIYNVFFTYDYSDVFTFIEGFINLYEFLDYKSSQRFSLRKTYCEAVNLGFQEENVNYRITNGIITDIVNPEEIKSVEETLKNKYEVVRKHFNNAVEKLYKEKDYNNSIKESISSVEAMCQILTKNNKATLGDALKLLDGKIHSAMKTAFEKMYGYTSDANGIRHANGLGEGESTLEEARYMLITCSAFVNYLKECLDDNN